MIIFDCGPEDRIIIGDGPDAITVAVLTIGQQVTQHGFEAPPSVAIDREEVRRAKNANTQRRVAEATESVIDGGDTPRRR